MRTSKHPPLFRLTWPILALGLGYVTTASADSVSLPFDIPATGFSVPPGSGPWGTITLTLNAGGTIDMKVQMPAGYITDFLCFDVPGSVSGFAVSGMPSDWHAAAFTSVGCGDALGGYNAYIASQTGYLSPSADVVSSFDVTLSRSSGFASVMDVVSTSAYGTSSLVDFAEEVGTARLCPGPSCDIGIAGAAMSAPEPLEAPCLLASAALLLLIAIRRRPRRLLHCDGDVELARLAADE